VNLRGAIIKGILYKGNIVKNNFSKPFSTEFHKTLTAVNLHMTDRMPTEKSKEV
jgi:hypothetical protein